MKVTKHNSTLAFLSMFLVYGNAIGADLPDTTCVDIEKKAQEGPLTEDEKIIFRACVLNGTSAGINTEVLKAISNASSDLTKGPGPNNDLVGREGWLRSRIGF